MKILSLCLAIILVILAPPLKIAARADVTESAELGAAYLTYSFDAEHSLLNIFLTYSGEGVSAIGAVLEYDEQIMDYTSYERGGGFDGFNITATLDNSGEIKILAYSGELISSGEIIRLSFKIEDGVSADGCKIGLSPLSSSPAAVIRDGVILPIEVSFSGVEISAPERLPKMTFGGRTLAGRLLVLTDSSISGVCLFEVTVIELSGNIRKMQLACKSKTFFAPQGKISCFALNVGKLGAGYTSVIVDAYYKRGDDMLAGREIYLFRDGKYM